MEDKVRGFLELDAKGKLKISGMYSQSNELNLVLLETGWMAFEKRLNDAEALRAHQLLEAYLVSKDMLPLRVPADISTVKPAPEGLVATAPIAEACPSPTPATDYLLGAMGVEDGKGNPASVLYEDEHGKAWKYNLASGEWDIPAGDDAYNRAVLERSGF